MVRRIGRQLCCAQAQINLGTESLAAIILARNKIKAEPPFDFLRLLNARKFAGSELTETDIPKQDFTGQEATAWIYYACEYKMVGNKVWENRLLRRSLSLCKSPLAQYLVAQNLREEGQYEKAKEMLEQISSSCSPGLRRQIDKLGQKVRDALEVEQTRKALF